MPYIPHPAVDSEPVSHWRYFKWRIGVLLERIGERWQNQAMDRCEMCGSYRHGRDHSACDRIPF